MSTENQEGNKAGLKILLSYGNFPLIVVEPKCKYSIIFILYAFIIDVKRIFLFLVYSSILILIDIHYYYLYLEYDKFLKFLFTYYWYFISFISFFFVCLANPGIINDIEYSEKKIKEKYQNLNRFIFCEKCNINRNKIILKENFFFIITITIEIFPFYHIRVNNEKTI